MKECKLLHKGDHHDEFDDYLDDGPGEMSGDVKLLHATYPLSCVLKKIDRPVYEDEYAIWLEFRRDATTREEEAK